MSDYIIHYLWPYGHDMIRFDSDDKVFAWLTNGFQPTECHIVIEHKGVTYDWDRDEELYTAKREQ